MAICTVRKKFIEERRNFSVPVDRQMGFANQELICIRNSFDKAIAAPVASIII